MRCPPPIPTLFPYTTLFRSDTMTEAEHVLERGMDEMKKQMEIQRQQEQEALQAQAQASMQEKEADAQIKQLDNETSIRVAEIGAQARGSEEHTSELQSRLHLVCRLQLEKKKN